MSFRNPSKPRIRIRETGFFPWVGRFDYTHPAETDAPPTDDALSKKLRDLEDYHKKAQQLQGTP